MEENQAVSLWGVSTRNSEADDPPVSQGFNDDAIAWQLEHRRCSIFMAVMLHYQAVCGGFPFCATGDAPDKSDYRFEKHGWTHYGEVNSLMAYSRQNQVVCLAPFSLPFMDKVTFTVSIGAQSKGNLQAIAKELGVTIN